MVRVKFHFFLHNTQILQNQLLKKIFFFLGILMEISCPLTCVYFWSLLCSTSLYIVLYLIKIFILLLSKKLHIFKVYINSSASILQNRCFWSVVLEKTLESPLDCKEIQPLHPKGNNSWIFTERTDVEAETPILWPPDMKNWLTGKDPDAGKDWRQEEKGTAEDEMVGWHHRLNGREFE